MIFLRTILLLLCCGTQVSVSGQNAKPYAPYYEQILKAEEAIASDDLERAVGHFASAFRDREHVFARDAFNACQLAAYTNSEFFPAMWAACAHAGVEKELLTNNVHIGKVYRQLSDVADKSYEEGRAKFMNRIDKELRSEFKTRYNTEQQSKGKENYLAVCTDNFNRILELTKQGRFPGEDVIGTDDNISCYYVLATLLHYPYSYTAMGPYLWKAVEDGKLPPAAAIYVYSFNQTRTSILYKGVPDHSEHFKTCYNMSFGKMSQDIAEVNRQRKLKWVPNVETELKVKAVMRRHGMVYLDAF